MSKSAKKIVVVFLTLAIGSILSPKVFMHVKSMWDWYEPALGLVDSIILSFGAVGALLVMWLKNRKYTGVRMEVRQGGEVVEKKGLKALRHLSPSKAKEIAEDENTRAVFLKGFTSPYRWINLDILQISFYDEAEKCWVIDLDQDEPSKPRGPSKELQEIEALKAEVSEMKALLKELLEG